jgi:hypothetical protein
MSYWKKSSKGENVNVEAKETVKEVESLGTHDVPERGIRKEILERFGVKVAVSEQDGKTPTAIYFPSFNQKGKITGYTKQDLSKGKEEKYHWSTIGSVNIANKLFGQQVAEKINRKRTNLIVTEGQWDAISTFQSLVDSVAGTKYEGIEPLVVSIPMGTANAVESLLHNEEYIKSHTAMTLFFDNDHCTPAELKKNIMKGKEARNAVAGAFIDSGLKLQVVEAEGEFKDASDYMQANKSGDLAKLVQFGKKDYVAEKIIKASDISLEEILTPREEGIYVECFPKLMDKIHGFRTRELVVLTSPSGVGKSTVTSLFASAFMEAGEKVGMIYLEEDNKETMQRLLASSLKVSYLKFKSNPLDCATVEEITEAYNNLINNDNLVMLDHFGSLRISEFMNKIKHMHLVEGCRYIIVDHLSMLLSGLEVTDERKELDVAMTSLAAFCAANDVCVIAVSHINRSAADLFKAPKVKEGEEEKPYWVKITKEMMRGSSSLEQLSWIVLGLEPEIMPDRSRGRVRLTSLKNRPWGYTGVADTFMLDDETWDVILMEDAPETF